MARRLGLGTSALKQRLAMRLHSGAQAFPPAETAPVGVWGQHVQSAPPRPRKSQKNSTGPPFTGRLDVDGLVWDRSATKVARSASLADERALLREIGAYVGGGGGEWAGGDTDSGGCFCSPSGRGSGDDRGAGDYL